MEQKTLNVIDRFNMLDSALHIDGREFYDYYRKNRKKSVKWLKDHTLFERAVGAMFLEIQKMLIEAEGGVYLEDFGYFAVLMNPKKTSTKLPYCNPQKDSYKYIRKTHKYIPYLFTDLGKMNFRGWTMSSTFDDGVLDSVKASKTNYRLYYSALKQLYKANKITKFTKHKDAKLKRDNS